MTDTRTPGETLAAAYANAPAATKHRDRLARIYRPNAMLDRLIALRATDPARFEQVMTPTWRAELGMYEQQKAAYQEVNGDGGN